MPVSVENEEQDVVDLSSLKELARSSLIDCLNSVNGAKTVVLDPSLAGPLDLLTEVSLFKHHGVDKMFWLEAGPLSLTTTNVVYLCRAKITWIKLIADQIKQLLRSGQRHTYTLFLVPRTSSLVTRILEEEGVLGEVFVSSFNLQFIPLENDVLSLENDNAFKEIWADGDETVIYDSAQALLTFQKYYGVIPRIVGKGDYAAKLAKLLSRQTSQASGGSSASSDSLPTVSRKVDSLIILDRRVDMITPLLTQLTYEGLIDELVGIKNSRVELPLSVVEPPPPVGAASTAPAASSSTGQATNAAPGLAKEKKKKHPLNGMTDPLFTEIRDLNFSSVGRKLNETARKLEESQNKIKQLSVAQLREFVKGLGATNEHRSIGLHIRISEMLLSLMKSDEFNKTLEIQQNLQTSYETSAQLSAVEDLLAQGADMQTILRLLCLTSLTTGGIKTKILDNLKREILQTYGYEHLPLLISLSSPSLGILLPTPLPTSMTPDSAASKLPFSAVRKSLRLLSDDAQESNDPDDITYVYSGFAPMSVRLVQCVAQKGGILIPPTGSEGKGKSAATSGSTSAKARAHPIVGWKGFEDVIASIPGETFDIVQKTNNSDDGGLPAPETTQHMQDQTTTTVVFFLGGCTYTEIAALRWVGKQSRGRRIMVATTGITSGAKLIRSLSGQGSGGSGQ